MTGLTWVDRSLEAVVCRLGYPNKEYPTICRAFFLICLFQIHTARVVTCTGFFLDSHHIKFNKISALTCCLRSFILWNNILSKFTQ